MTLGKKVILCLLTTVIVLACKKEDEVLMPSDGIFRGVFTRTLTNGDTSGVGVVFLAMFENDMKFSLQGDSVSNAPYTCSGTYSLISDDEIKFKNSAPIGIVIEDENYILDTNYQFEFLDTSFQFNFNAGGFKYNYNLTRF